MLGLVLWVDLIYCACTDDRLRLSWFCSLWMLLVRGGFWLDYWLWDVLVVCFAGGLLCCGFWFV